MLTKPCPNISFLLLLLPALLLSSLVSAAPNPSALAEPIRPPRPSTVPGCPSYRDLISLNKRFIRTIAAPEIATFYQGYYGFTADYFWDNFTITDTTANYPAAQKGKKKSAPGTWANSRTQFAKGLTEGIPEFRTIYGNIEEDPNELNYGGQEGDDCLTAFWKGTYTATLKKAYG
jgi:hypothetical protein